MSYTARTSKPYNFDSLKEKNFLSLTSQSNVSHYVSPSYGYAIWSMTAPLERERDKGGTWVFHFLCVDRTFFTSVHNSFARTSQMALIKKYQDI